MLALLLTAGWYYYNKVNVSAQSISNSGEQTEIVRRGDLTVSASGTGTLVAQTEASFGFDTAGQVTQVNVKIGDQVEEGQALAQLDDTLLQMEYVEAQQALEELYSAASIAAVRQEIGTAQDAEFYAHEWIKSLLSPEVVEAEENVAIAQQSLAEAQAEAAASPSDATALTVKQKEQAVAYLQDKLTQAQAYYEDYIPARELWHL